MNKHRREAPRTFSQWDKTDQGKQSKDVAVLLNSDKLQVPIIKSRRETGISQKIMGGAGG